MSQPFINVHTFDGKLRDVFEPERLYTVSEKKEKFLKLINQLSNHTAIVTVQTMINDLDHPKGSNFQAENNVDASDILMDILQRVDIIEVLKDLNEQLADARNLGICPSGRVTRLLQIWRAYLNK